ncbi:MAG: hypothetical protein H7Y59_16790 [Anaerolineales bacterium]|nr:hypothetical protein [Anaerolineales bacterium]
MFARMEFIFPRGGGSRALAHANIQLLIQPDWNAEQTINQAEKAILSLDYVKQPQNPSKFADLEERSYKKGNFTISYSPEDGEYKLLAVWLHFYEEDEYAFSEAGFTEYESIRKALATAELEQSLENDPRYPGRTIQTPKMFNDRHPHPEQSSATEILFGLSTLLYYVLIFFLPGFWIALKFFRHLGISNILKRIIFVVSTSLILAPTPLPIIMFGPVFLLPMPFVLPFVLESGAFLKLLAVSVGCTAILASLISLLIRNPRPSNEVPEILS